MNDLFIYDELDRAIDQPSAPRSSQVETLLSIAGELECLPRPGFKSQLKLELEWEAGGRSMTSDSRQPSRPGYRRSQPTAVLSTFYGKAERLYPLRGANVAASAAIHAALLLLLGTGLVSVHRARILQMQGTPHETNLVAYVPPKGDGHEGKGGGGANSKTDASKGELPPASRLQFTPPVVEIRDHDPKLPIAATLIAPPNLNLPDEPIGKALSTLLVPSGGPGVRGGIGAGSGGGIGDKDGPEAGDGAFPGGVSPPRAIYHPEPEYSEEARRVHFQGVVSLLIVVEPDGRASHLRVMRSLGMGLDEKALEAVRTWRFEPGTKEGRPVPVLMEVEVDFRIH
jgi:periplasmic protein TonB